MPGDEAIRIFHPDHDAPNSRGNQRVRARTGSAEVAAWLEIYIKSSAAGFCAGAFERNSLRVFQAVVGMKSLADYFSIFNDDRANARIRMSQRESATGKRESAIHPLFVGYS